jgi:hypothetical protein
MKVRARAIAERRQIPQPTAEFSRIAMAEERKGMHYLITGGAGFIGSHLAEKLLSERHTVTVIDDLCTGSIQNIEYLKSKRGFHYIVDSIFNRPLLAELIDDCDAVFHLAASVGVRLIVESPVRTIENNVRGTEWVLEFANKKKKKVLVASTSEVYGKSRKIPFSEDDDLVMGPIKGDGAMPALRQSTNFSHWPIGRKGVCRWSSCGFSIPSARVKRVATAWCFPISCARRSPDKH